VSGRLPPLPTLRAFEAACRLQSYSLAAAELHVSQGAVSQQIRALEEELGQRLFTRSANRMIPTDAALRLASAVRDGLGVLRSGLDEFRSLSASSLVLSVMPSFGRLWLGPRVATLGALWPDVAFQIRTDRALANFNDDGVDLGVRVGDGQWPGLEVVHLANTVAFPVASPELRDRLLAEGGGRIDLTRAPLLEPDNPEWSAWVAADRRRPTGGLSATIFDDADMVVDAALDGGGVALVRSVLVDRLLNSGRLVRLLAPSSTPGAAYFAVWPRRSSKARLIASVVEWLKEEVESSVVAAERI
jgi:LysR family glycine cleavage system transcriptional activator